MSRIFASMVTVVLASCIFIPFILNGGKGFAVVALIAVGILWSVALWRNMPAGLKAPLVIVFSILVFVSVIGSLVSVGKVLSERLDRPESDAPLVYGEDAGAGRMAIVYHPGGSGLARGIVTRLAEELAVRRYAVTILTARPGLAFNQGEYGALILVSPVYGGEVRPPLEEFVRVSSPFSLPVFIVFSGWFPSMKDEDLARFSKSQEGVKIREATKIGWGRPRKALEERIAAFVEIVDEAMRRDAQ